MDDVIKNMLLDCLLEDKMEKIIESNTNTILDLIYNTMDDEYIYADELGLYTEEDVLDLVDEIMEEWSEEEDIEIYSDIDLFVRNFVIDRFCDLQIEETELNDRMDTILVNVVLDSFVKLEEQGNLDLNILDITTEKELVDYIEQIVKVWKSGSSVMSDRELNSLEIFAENYVIFEITLRSF